jgi:hypothetical protein
MNINDFVTLIQKTKQNEDGTTTLPTTVIRQMMQQLCQTAMPQLPDDYKVKLEALRRSKEWTSIWSNQPKSKQDSYYEGFLDCIKWLGDKK